MTTALTISSAIPPSLKEAMMVNKEAIHLQKTTIGLLRHELVEQEAKIEIAIDLDIPNRSFITRKKSLMRQIELAQNTVLAYEAGYLEIPNFGSAQQIETNKDVWWKFRFDGKTPLRVLKAVKEAQERGFFKKIMVAKPRRAPDPIVVGVIGRIHFYITSWK